MGLSTYQLVQDFFHPQYVPLGRTCLGTLCQLAFRWPLVMCFTWSYWLDDSPLIDLFPRKEKQFFSQPGSVVEFPGTCGPSILDLEHSTSDSRTYLLLLISLICNPRDAPSSNRKANCSDIEGKMDDHRTILELINWLS